MCTMQFYDIVAKCRKSPANLSVATFVHANSPSFVIAVLQTLEYKFAFAVG